MKQSVAMRVWNILYPVFIYYVVTIAAIAILDLFLPETTDSKLFRQLLTSFAALPFLYSFYRQDVSVRDPKEVKKWNFRTVGIIFVTGGCFAIAWNNLLGLIHIAEYSRAYKQVETTFYTGRMILEVIALCVVIPVVEELLYRGIVYGRLKDWLGCRTAIVASAVIFGLVHMNLVQFVYAAVFGLLLAYFAEVSGNLSGPVAAHAAANLTSVLRAETGVFGWMDGRTDRMIAGMVLLFGIAGVGVFSLRRKR